MSQFEKWLAVVALVIFVIAGNLWWWGIEYPHLIGAGCHL